MPSSFAPRRSIAARERVLRASVRRFTRTTHQDSKAWVSISSLASVFTAVRCASAASHVQPTSTASGGCGGARTPAGQRKYSRLKKRVDPITRPVARWTVAKGTAAPASRSASASCTYRSMAASPSGTQVYAYVSRGPEAASVSAGNPDPNSANNSATVSSSVVVAPPPSQFYDGGFETPPVGSGASVSAGTCRSASGSSRTCAPSKTSAGNMPIPPAARRCRPASSRPLPALGARPR